MNSVTKLLKELGVDNVDTKTKVLEKYMSEILILNESVNLTAITNREEFVEKHYLDSLLCAKSPEFINAKKVIDIGTGGGFPGIPLAVAFPEKKFVLVDSLNKRVEIIRCLCKKLDIGNVTAVHERAENLARKKNMREGFDLCVSRAVANMSTLAEYCLPFVRKGGSFIAYKGPGCAEELAAAEGAIEILGGELDRVDLAQTSDANFFHRLIYVRKIKNTPETYPRKAGRPAKNPIKCK